MLGLGEPTHSTREAFLFKTRVVEDLVSDGKTHAILFEAHWRVVRALEDSVVSGRGDLPNLLRLVPLLHAEESIELFAWLRQRALKREFIPRLIGIDVQDTRRPPELVQVFTSESNVPRSKARQSTRGCAA